MEVKKKKFGEGAVSKKGGACYLLMRDRGEMIAAPRNKKGGTREKIDSRKDLEEKELDENLSGR